MKRVLLLGDSIRIGYCREVKEVFAGKAEVLFPDENCRFAEYFLRHLTDWKEETCENEDVDVLHWNAGLWDCLRQYDEEPLTPIEIYRYYMERVCRRIRLLFPKAKVIFATSTPIQEEMYGTTKEFFRYNADICAYNAVAVDVVKQFGMEVNDLYAVAERFPKDYYTDATHPYSAQGRYALAKQVTAYVADALNMEAPEVPCDIALRAGTIEKISGF